MISEADRPTLNDAADAVQAIRSTIPPALTAAEYGKLDKAHRASWVFVTLPSGAQRYIPKVWGTLQTSASQAANDLSIVLAVRPPVGYESGYLSGYK